MNAKELIGQRAMKQAPDLTPAMLKEVKQVVDHNDSTGSPQRRVGAAHVVALLKEMGWAGRSRKALDEVCARQMKRRSFTTP